MSTRNFFIVAILASFVISCQKETLDNVPTTSGTVDSDLQAYMDRFVAEAAERGITVPANLNGIQASIVDINEEGVVGYCYSGGAGSNEIEIDRTFWNNASELQRELVMFHELGHCYLDRDHDEASSNNGVCLSLMNSGAGSCNDEYNTATRSYYIDELFNPSVKSSSPFEGS